MKVKDLLSALPEFDKKQTELSENYLLRDVSDLVQDHRKLVPGAVFVAIKGTGFDGHSVLREVCNQDTSAVIVEDSQKVPADFKGIVLEVENSRRSLSQLAARWSGDPTLALFTFGVTGTNGKTSCTYLMEHILNSYNVSCGVIGTIGHHLKEKKWSTDNTTPGPIELQARLHEMQIEGAKSIAMEVSSHALDQGRVDNIHFNTVLFTNLTLDHLDYHKSMQEYFLAKQRLFTDLLWETKKNPSFAVVNTDDDWGKKLKIAYPSGLWTYGQNKHAQWKFSEVVLGFTQTEFKLKCPFGEYKVLIPMSGLHNVYNVVGVIAAASTLGILPEMSITALRTFVGVPGRMQPVLNEKGINVIVDYAHSPDALENVLNSISKVKNVVGQGRIITVFGCGGDRDKKKRPLMAAIAEKFSDQVIVTSDNPRTENPETIIEEIKSGFINANRAMFITDRKKAIEKALSVAQQGDVVLIAGKGHEDYQIIGTEKNYFSDYVVAKNFLG